MNADRQTGAGRSKHRKAGYAHPRSQQKGEAGETEKTEIWERTGKDRKGQERTGKDRKGQRKDTERHRKTQKDTERYIKIHKDT